MDAHLWTIGVPVVTILLVALGIGKSPKGAIRVLQDVAKTFKNIFVR